MRVADSTRWLRCGLDAGSPSSAQAPAVQTHLTIPTDKIWQLTEADDLLVLHDSLAPAMRRKMVRRWLSGAAPDLLAGPVPRSPVDRMLVVHEPSRSSVDFLGMAAELGRSLRIAPVVLTMARTERTAHAGQQAAQDLCREQQLDADFDLLVGSAGPETIVRISRWRHCGIVVIEQPNPTSWRRWLWSSNAERLLVSAPNVSVLGLPARGASARSLNFQFRRECARPPLLLPHYD